VNFAKGDVVFDTTWPGASPAQLAAFSQGTEDPNPIHIDEEFARRAGFRAVLQQGPMTTAHFAHLFESHVGRGCLETLDVDFLAPVFVNEDLRLLASVVEAGDRLTCSLVCTKTDGTETARGKAVVRLKPMPPGG
jgi:acyl dehydratase